MGAKYIEVVVPRAVDKVFHYALSEGLIEKAGIGQRVLVPFGKGHLIGLITGFSDQPGVEKVKQAIEILDKSPILDMELLGLAKKLSDLYLFPLGMVIKYLLPPTIFSRKSLPDLPVSTQNTQESKVQELSTSQLPKFRSSEVQSTDPNLQYKGALDEIIKRADSLTFSPLLLHADWENRWEIYLQLTEYMIKKNKNSILLVPEITIIPTFVDKLKKRFDGRLALFHSGLSPKERLIEWERMWNGEVDVVLGVRSAIFSPFKELGLIVIDEEQDRSYKQEEGLRYNTREVAEIRVRDNGALLILGSSVLSVESFYRAEKGKYKYLHLHDDKPSLPNIEIVDLREQRQLTGKRKDRGPILTERLLVAIGDKIKKKERALIFINRLGYSTSILCSDCGFILKCPHCDIPLPYHSTTSTGERSLQCHYCGHREVPPTSCPLCKGTRLYFAGTGTQKVEEEIKRSFPEATILRIDRDTIRNKASYTETFQKIKETEVLIGTQMVLRFKPLPPIALIGIVSENSLYLNLPDFRGSEKTFQLLMQLASLVEKGGEIVLQTFNPEHYAIQYAQRYDYDGFYQRDIEYRRVLGYPPFSHLICITLTGRQEERVKESSRKLVDILKSHHTPLYKSGEQGGFEVLGPTRSPVSRIKGRYRWQVVIKELRAENQEPAGRAYLKEALRQWQKEPSPKGIEVDIDVNP